MADDKALEAIAMFGFGGREEDAAVVDLPIAPDVEAEMGGANDTSS